MTSFEKICREKNITLAKVCRITGLKYRTMHNFWKGHKRPPLDVAMQLSMLLETPIEQLFPLQGEAMEVVPLSSETASFSSLQS